ASDVGRSAADFVFLGSSLSVVDDTLAAVTAATRLVKQNFALAAVYNAISLPFALAGFVTPLIAAVAMSTAAILVAANAPRPGAAGKTRVPERAPRSGRLAERGGCTRLSSSSA